MTIEREIELAKKFKISVGWPKFYESITCARPSGILMCINPYKTSRFDYAKRKWDHKWAWIKYNEILMRRNSSMSWRDVEKAVGETVEEIIENCLLSR